MLIISLKAFSYQFKLPNFFKEQSLFWLNEQVLKLKILPACLFVCPVSQLVWSSLVLGEPSLMSEPEKEALDLGKKDKLRH